MRLARVIPPVLLLAAVAHAPNLAHAVIHHVTTTGSPAGDGSIASPYDLATGLSVMAPGDSVYIANGSYTWTESVSGLIPIQNSCLIEGSFDPSTWTKTLSPGTTITVTPDLHVYSGVSGYYVGIDVSSHSGFVIRDLSLSVLPQGALGTYASRGISVYGAHLVSCSNYSFSRVSIITGAASRGENGVAGTNGTDGMHGDPGMAAGATCGDGGAGGAGAGNVPTAASQGCNVAGTDGLLAGTTRMGGSGAAGGAGGALELQSHAGNGGSGGTGGDPDAYGGSGGAGAYPNCDPAIAGLSGSTGMNGMNGEGYPPGSRSEIADEQKSNYFIAADTVSGGVGAGGAGGGGGGGGGGTFYEDSHCYPTNTPFVGAGGGGGGGGGEGGAGGSGGYGGGSSYGVYLVTNGANTSFTCCGFMPGAAGIGGDGAIGGAGGAPGAGGTGGPSVNRDSGAGGSGAAGGAGGDGGRGQDGVNGESVPWILVSGTAPTVSCQALAIDDVRGPMAFALHASQPNPTASFTRIAYDVPREAKVTLRVFDTQGRSVRLLATGFDSPGRKSVGWDLRDDHGVRVRAGIYFYRFTADRFEALQRVIVLD